MRFPRILGVMVCLAGMVQPASGRIRRHAVPPVPARRLGVDELRRVRARERQRRVLDAGGRQARRAAHSGHVGQGGARRLAAHRSLFGVGPVSALRRNARRRGLPHPQQRGRRRAERHRVELAIGSRRWRSPKASGARSPTGRARTTAIGRTTSAKSSRCSTRRFRACASAAGATTLRAVARGDGRCARARAASRRCPTRGSSSTRSSTSRRRLERGRARRDAPVGVDTADRKPERCSPTRRRSVAKPSRRSARS